MGPTCQRCRYDRPLYLPVRGEAYCPDCVAIDVMARLRSLLPMADRETTIALRIAIKLTDSAIGEDWLGEEIEAAIPGVRT